MAWKANGNMDLPLAEQDREWDGDEVRERIFTRGGRDDNPQPERARRAFFAYDDEHPQHKRGYKLPFADVIGQRLIAVPHGIFAVAEVLEGARGGVDLPGDVIESIRGKVAAYYRKLGAQPPW
jgi:hypothetical protein